MYDWANSAFATTIMAAIMPIYYQKVIGGTDGDWAFTQTAAAIVIALSAPLLGAIAVIPETRKDICASFMLGSVRRRASGWSSLAKDRCCLPPCSSFSA